MPRIWQGPKAPTSVERFDGRPSPTRSPRPYAPRAYGVIAGIGVAALLGAMNVGGRSRAGTRGLVVLLLVLPGPVACGPWGAAVATASEVAPRRRSAPRFAAVPPVARSRIDDGGSGFGDERRPSSESVKPYSKPVAVFWIGVDGGADVFPPVDVDTMMAVYEANHFRVMRFDGASPRVLGLSMLLDRQKHPENYFGAVVPLILHGNGLVTTIGMHADAVGPTAIPRRVTTAELASAFLVGIGGDAIADVAEASCLVGGQCREIPLEGTPLEKNVQRWLVREGDPTKAKPVAATRLRQERLLSRLLDALLVAVRAVSPLAAPIDDDPDGFRPFTYRNEDKAPSNGAQAMSFSELAEREALLQPKASSVGR